jgi:cytochrome-b5 reductase
MSAPSLTSSQNINGIYIPAGLLIVGTLIVKKEWTPFAALLAVALGALKFFNQRELCSRRYSET